MKPDITKMTLREKLGQTGIPSPSALAKAVKAQGGYEACFTAYPYSGMYVNANTLIHDDGTPFESPAVAEAYAENARCSLTAKGSLPADI